MEDTNCRKVGHKFSGFAAFGKHFNSFAFLVN